MFIIHHISDKEIISTAIGTKIIFHITVYGQHIAVTLVHDTRLLLMIINFISYSSNTSP